MSRIKNREYENVALTIRPYVNPSKTGQLNLSDIRQGIKTAISEGENIPSLRSERSLKIVEEIICNL